MAIKSRLYQEIHELSLFSLGPVAQLLGIIMSVCTWTLTEESFDGYRQQRTPNTENWSAQRHRALKTVYWNKVPINQARWENLEWALLLHSLPCLAARIMDDMSVSVSHSLLNDNTYPEQGNLLFEICPLTFLNCQTLTVTLNLILLHLRSSFIMI